MGDRVGDRGGRQGWEIGMGDREIGVGHKGWKVEVGDRDGR